MTETGARGHLLDTSALIGLTTSRRMSTLVATAPLFHTPLYAPVACVDAADRSQPGIARHVGRIPAIKPVELTYSAVLGGRVRTPDVPLPVAQVLHLALLDRLGLIVTTAEPELYREFDVPLYLISN